MMRSERNSPAPAAVHLSWADEVEKEEEEEEAQPQLQEQQKQEQKPNPFGSARPREVVLQEKGIDWRNQDLNLDLHKSPCIRKESVDDEDPNKENIPPTSLFVASSRLHSEPVSSFFKQRHRNANPGLNLLPVPKQQMNMNMIAGPSLRYPPKNAVNILYKSENNYGQQRRVQRLDSSVPRIHLNGKQTSQNSVNHKLVLHIERIALSKENAFKFQLVGESRNFEEPRTAYGKGQYSDPNHSRRNSEMNSQKNTMRSLLGKPPVQQKTYSSINVRNLSNGKGNSTTREATGKPLKNQNQNQHPTYQKRSVSQYGKRSGIVEDKRASQLNADS